MGYFGSRVFVYGKLPQPYFVHPRTQDRLAYLPKRDEPLPLYPSSFSPPSRMVLQLHYPEGFKITLTGASTVYAGV
jgi:hypothetical protein